MGKKDSPKNIDSSSCTIMPDDSSDSFLTENKPKSYSGFKVALAELFGTMLFVFMGCGAVGAVTFSEEMKSIKPVVVAVGFGLGLFLGILISNNVSGGHLNPAVSLGMAFAKRIPFRRLQFYIPAQIAGAFLGAALTFFIYTGKINEQGSKDEATASIFVAFPSQAVSSMVIMYSEIVLTACFVLVILCSTSSKASKVINPPQAISSILGLLVLTFGTVTGCSLNPARDLGPRLFTMIAGWGLEPFKAHSFFFWIPNVFPYVGAILGSTIYVLLPK
ncbi:hypothetical protein BB560_000239 [Smittium megazygosporum]|uniref:Uncharacterized protein n=1 Tax=Smittium megazygosporum TaxID=133381 RepID=A0A2T9ZKX1_9FUNG|nr:hypothetical protein BB560_000239 [Smittium megazygosporum]